MIRLVTHNLGMKIVALLLALGLWVFVAAAQNNVAKFPGSIPVKAVNVPTNFSAIYDTKEVNLKIAADPSVWKQLSSDNFSAFVDLNGLAAGTHNLKVIVNPNLPNVSVIEVDPANIMVRLEPVEKKTVSVAAVIIGQAADGRTIGSIDFTPDKVEISGPKSLIGGATAASAIVKLNGESDGFSRDITLSVLNDKNEAINEITINPATAKADVTIVKAGNNKTVGVKAVTTGLAASGFFVSNIVVDPATVDVVGQDSLLRTTQYIETLPVDIAGQSDTLVKTVALSLPAGITLQKDSNQKVKVTISFSGTSTSKEIVATINPINLNPGLAVTGYTPSAVKIVASGPANLVNNLTSADVVLNLDLANKSTSSGIGVDLTAAMFKVPAGVTVASFLPSSLSVAIGQK